MWSIALTSRICNGWLGRFAILPGTARKPQLIFRRPEVAIDPLLKLNGNCGGDRGPSIAPQAEQHKKQVAEQLLGLRALRLRYRSGVLDRGALRG